MRQFFFLLTILFCFNNSLSAQFQLSGIVTDSLGAPLPFVNILINDSQKDGVSTDIDGKFSINHDKEINRLTFSYLGFETLVLTAPFKSNIKVILVSTAYSFEEVTVVAGENPAHRIIRKVVENRDLNDPEKMDSYSCQTYNKMVLGYTLATEKMHEHYLSKDTTKKRIKKLYKNYQKSHEIFTNQDLMIIESATNRQFKKTHDLREEVLLNRISGTKRLPITAIATQTQPFSFYKEEVIIFDQAFLNPISKNSAKKYFFQITDTLYQKADTVFIIAFQPKKGKNFNGLEGQLHINSNQFAIQNVIAKPNKEDHLTLFEITQKYKWVNNQHWFPEQLLFEMESSPLTISFSGIKMYGRTYISAVNLNPSLNKKVFNQGEEVVIDMENYSRNDSLWSIYRKEELSEKEEKTYTVVDSLFEAKKLDRWFALMEYIGQERFKLGPFDYDLSKLINGNRFESLKLGVGLSTNRDFSNKIEIGGYGVYGFGDKEWKYGGHVGLLFDKNRDNRLDFIYRKDLHVPAEPKFIQRGDFLNFSQIARLRDKIIYKGVNLQTFPIKYLRLNAKISQQQITPLYDYKLLAEVPNNKFTFSEFHLGIRYAYNEKFVRLFGQRLNNQSNFPIVELQYIKGLDNFWNGEWAYDKLLFSVNHTFRRKALGKTKYRLEAGYINNVVPYSKLFTSFGLGAGYRGFGLGISQGFQTMKVNEFLSDRFVHLFFKQDFGTLLLKSKKFKPNIVFEHNLAFGSLQRSEIHQNIEFKTLEKGFFEAGLVLENLIKVKYFNMYYIGLGAGMYYRYGPYQNEIFKDNVAWGMKISISY